MTNLPDLITFAFGSSVFFWGQLRRIRRQFFWLQNGAEIFMLATA